MRSQLRDEVNAPPTPLLIDYYTPAPLRKPLRVLPLRVRLESITVAAAQVNSNAAHKAEWARRAAKSELLCVGTGSE